MARLHSFSVKMMLALGLVVVVAVGAVALAVNASAGRHLEDYVTAGMQARAAALAPTLERYYIARGSWAGVAESLQPGHAMGRGMGPMRMHGNPLAGLGGVVLADAGGQVLLDTTTNGGLDRLAPALLRVAEPLEDEGGAVVGYLVVGSGPQEALLAENLGRSILYAGLAAGAVAIALGLVLTRTVARPLQVLAEGTRRIGQGDLAHRVAVTSPDEIGDLARRFNEMAAALERQEESRRALTADVAHELRTPLAVIRAQVEALQDGVFDLTPEAVAPIHDQVLLLGRLVDDLRELALAEAGQLPLERSETDPAALAERVAAAFGPRAQTAGIDLRVEAPAGLSPLWADAQRLEQVLANLLTNALRHTPPGGRVALRVAEEGGRLAFRVEDSGSGIAPEDLPHVFDRFYRGDPARSTGDGHTGLGLSIAQGLARAHGGEITVESCPGAGSTFIVTLPTGVARTTPNAPITSSG